MARGSGAVWSEDGATLGASLRSTRGPTSGWPLLATAVSVALSLAGLLCAVELVVSAGGSRFTAGVAGSAPAGLFGQGGAGKNERAGGGQSGGVNERRQRVQEREREKNECTAVKI